MTDNGVAMIAGNRAAAHGAIVEGATPVAPGRIEAAIADFVCDFRFGDLAEPQLLALRRLVQDQMGNQIACSQLPWSRATLAFAKAVGQPGPAHVVCSPDRLTGRDAAFVNATYGHAFEYDDAHRESASHPGACVVPAALALAEEVGASMADALAAMVVGYEVYTRIGSIAAPQLLSRGFHPHCVLSTFGAAAIAARLYGLNREQTGHALAIAFSHASGTTEYTSGGGSVKRVHSGIGTLNGIRAALMARHGITGPQAYLTGNKGFYHTFVERAVAWPDLARFGVGAPFEIEKVWIKPYLCCGCIHAYIDALRPFASRAEAIAGVDVRIQSSANVPVGTKNAFAYCPTQIEHVQYSLPVQAAFALLGMGNGYPVHRAALTGELDLSPQGPILAMAGRVRMTEDVELDRRHPGKFVADVTVHFKDGGSEHVFVEDSIGTVENPMSQGQHDEKFHELVDGVLGRARADSLRLAIGKLGTADDVATVGAFTALAGA
jgi:2-methylcitrate dehydratase PrpD